MSRSRHSPNQPLILSKASNSLLFTTPAARCYRQVAPPEPIGKRSASSSSYECVPTSAADALLTRKSKERSGAPEFEYDIHGVRRQRSRPASIGSSRRSSVRRLRTAVKRTHSIETVRSRQSTTSGSRHSGRFGRLIAEEPASLNNVPVDIVHSIVRYLSRADLLNLILVCQQLRADATMLLYAKPYFISTYRFGQFVTTISSHSQLADLVREIDLSHLSKLPQDSGLAGWREWKYRTESLYSLYPTQNTESHVEGLPSQHPLAHPLLQKFSTGSHDIPLGSLMHIVKACPHIR